MFLVWNMILHIILILWKNIIAQSFQEIATVIYNKV